MGCVFSMSGRWDAFTHNFKQWLIAIDQVCNSTIGLLWGVANLLPLVPIAAKSWADETMSAHCWRLHLIGIDGPRLIVDWIAAKLGDDNHCEESYNSEREGRQLPPEERMRQTP